MYTAILLVINFDYFSVTAPNTLIYVLGASINSLHNDKTL